MEDNYGETFFLTNLLSSMAEEPYVPGFMNDPLPDIGIQQPLRHEIMQIEPSGHNTEQGSGEQGSGLPQAIMVGTEVNAAVTGRPGHDNGIQRFQGHNMLQIEPTGHNTEQGSGSGLPGGNEATVGDIRIGEQGSGSGSGLPQANMVETEATAAVPGRPGQKRNGEINSAERSKNSRAKKKKEEYDMKVEMQRLQEENKRNQEGIKRLQEENKRNQEVIKRLQEENKKKEKESNEKLNVQDRELRQSNAKLAESQKDLHEQKNTINSLSKTVENFSYLRKENKGLQIYKKLYLQQVNARTNAKKWVRIPFEDGKLKIEGNSLFIKMA